MNDDICREQLSAYLDDALNEPEMTRIEKALRQSPELRQLLQQVRDEHDRGEHTLGAIWRRERLSCLTREQLTQYLHQLLEDGFHKYVEFHLHVICCPICLANLDDLKEKQAEQTPQTQKRRQKIFDSTLGKLDKPTPSEKK
jgi:hypothetical protein